MFKSIQVEDFNFSSYPEISNQAVSEYKERNQKKLIDIQEYLLNKNNILSVDKIANHLFLNVEADIFLSHSHKDENDVIRLAILIEQKLGLKVFIDSCVWGNAYELLEKLDYEYCLDENGKNFHYIKRNHTTSNVFMILNGALHRIIDNCETFIFLGTDNTISITNAIDDKKYLSSPWIYSELQFAALVNRRLKRTLYNQKATESNGAILDSIGQDSAQFAYTPPKTDAILSNSDLMYWLNNTSRYINGSRNHPLDILYNTMTHRKHMK